MSEQLQVGDKVKVVRRGAIGWEIQDYTSHNLANLLDGVEYEVSNTSIHMANLCVQIKGDVKKYWIHPDHFKKV